MSVKLPCQEQIILVLEQIDILTSQRTKRKRKCQEFISFSVIFLFSENGVGSILLSKQLAESFGISSLGFYLGKLASRNSRRTWIELIWFQVLNFVCMLSAIAAKAAGVGVAYKAAVPLMLAFIVSFLVFLAVGNKKQIEPEVPEKK